MSVTEHPGRAERVWSARAPVRCGACGEVAGVGQQVGKTADGKRWHIECLIQAQARAMRPPELDLDICDEPACLWYGRLCPDHSGADDFVTERPGGAQWPPRGQTYRR